MLPLSRRDIADFLDSLQLRALAGDQLPAADEAWLRDLRVEFSYDLAHTLDESSAVTPDFRVSGIYDEYAAEVLYAYSDSTASVFIDGFAGWSYRTGNDDTPEPHFASLGEIGSVCGHIVRPARLFRSGFQRGPVQRIQGIRTP